MFKNMIITKYLKKRKDSSAHVHCGVQGLHEGSVEQHIWTSDTLLQSNQKINSYNLILDLISNSYSNMI